MVSLVKRVRLDKPNPPVTVFRFIPQRENWPVIDVVESRNGSVEERRGHIRVPVPAAVTVYQHSQAVRNALERDGVPFRPRVLTFGDSPAPDKR